MTNNNKQRKPRTLKFGVETKLLSVRIPENTYDFLMQLRKTDRSEFVNEALKEYIDSCIRETLASVKKEAKK